MKTGRQISDVPYMELWVTTDDEIVACWESEDLEQFLATAFELTAQDEQPDWDKVLREHNCTVLNRGDVVTVIGITEDSDPIEGEFHGYEFEFQDSSYAILNIDVQDPEGENIIYAIKSDLTTVRITPGADMWVILEFLEANTTEN